MKSPKSVKRMGIAPKRQVQWPGRFVAATVGRRRDVLIA